MSMYVRFVGLYEGGGVKTCQQERGTLVSDNHFVCFNHNLGIIRCTSVNVWYEKNSNISWLLILVTVNNMVFILILDGLKQIEEPE